MSDVALKILTQCWLVLGQMAPYLLFGFLVAGLLSVFVRPAWVERHLGRPGIGPVFTASLVGVPLPLCSCGVIPVAASIRRHGASRAATAAFLLSTPQTGVDSIAVTYALLGPVFAVFRPVAALVTGLVGGVLVQLFGESDPEVDKPAQTVAACGDACCTGQTRGGLMGQAFRYGFVTLPKDIGFALLIGIGIAGLMAGLLPQNEWHNYVGGGIVSILIMMAAGVPIYVCATASVPIAAGFMHVGASPGAALAFLIAGPATNAATLTTIWKVLGRRSAVLYALTVAASAVGFGLLLDRIMPAASKSLSALAGHVHGGTGLGWFQQLAAAVLLGVLAFSFFRRPSHPGEEPAAEEATAPKSQEEGRVELSVSGMRCSHCAASVERSLAEAPGVSHAEVDLDAGRAVVRGQRLDPQALAAIVTELGYSAEVIETG